MTRAKIIQLSLLAAAAVLALWQFQLYDRQKRRYAELQNQIQAQSRELERRKPILDEWERRSHVLQSERTRTNSNLETLVRQRAQVTSATSAARKAAQAEQNRIFRVTLADTLDNPQQKEINRSLLKNEIRARFVSANSKLNLAPDQLEQAVDLLAEDELKKTDRLAALLRGQIPVADALRERDAAFHELQTQLRSALGDNGYALYDEGRQSRARSQADRDINLINGDLGVSAMNATQTAQLRELIRAEVCNIVVDDTDTFRSPEDWDRFYNLAVERIERQASGFLTPEQLTAFRKLAASDLLDTQQTLATKRRGYGL